MKKKKILAIILVLLVVLLGGASVYVATQLSTRKAVAPTAPESKPKAVEPTIEWVGSEACTVTGVATTTSMNLRFYKDAYSGVLQPAPYTLNSSNILNGNDAVLKPGDTVVYWMIVQNNGDATVSGTLTFSDVLTGDNLDMLTYLEGDSGCSYETSTRTVTCDRGTVNATKGLGYGKAFRVKISDSATDGMIIKNTFTGIFNGQNGTGYKSFVVSKKVSVLEGSKTAYKNVTSNTPGNYTLTTAAETVSKSQIYVYTIELKNTSTATASGVIVKDSLKDMPVTYMDTVAGCTWNATNIELTCNTSINPGETKKFSFRVKASDAVANGTVISNTAKVTYPDGSLDLSKNSAVSTVVGCNHTCTTVEECSTGLTCDTTTSKCRTSACLTEDDCTCTIAVVPTVTRSATRASTVTATSTIAPTVRVTVAPTEEVIAEATPTILPETGIFDLPGIAAFGGGLFLAVIGILLAL